MAKKDESYTGKIKFNPGETYLIDRLVETHIYGDSRAEVVRNLVDQGLREALRGDLIIKCMDELNKRTREHGKKGQDN